MAIKIRINEILKEREIPIREFSRMIDHHHDQVRLISRGEVKRIPIDFLDKVCRTLHVPLHEVITYEEDVFENNETSDE